MLQCHREQNALQVQGDLMHTLYREKEEASQRRVTGDVGGINACGWVGATDKYTVPDSEGSSFKDCHQWPCWSHPRLAAVPQYWQPSQGSAERGSLRHPCWLTRQMREGWWWQCCSLSWRKSELRRKKKGAVPSSHHQPWRKTQGGSMRKMRRLDDVEVLGAVIVWEEGGLIVAAVQGLK